MTKPLVIFGNTEIARLAYEYFTHDSPYDVAGFTVDRAYIKDDLFEGLPLCAFEDVNERFPAAQYDAFVAVGSQQLNRLRSLKYNALKAMGYTLASYISSRCFRWHNVTIGDNAFILEDNTLQPFVTIGNNVTLWSGNHIGHSSMIRDHVFISSHVVISGFCDVGESTFIGVNAATADCVTIGADNYIGMGAVINGNTAPDSLMTTQSAALSKIGARRFCKVKHD